MIGAADTIFDLIVARQTNLFLLPLLLLHIRLQCMPKVILLRQWLLLCLILPAAIPSILQPIGLIPTSQIILSNQHYPIP